MFMFKHLHFKIINKVYIKNMCLHHMWFSLGIIRHPAPYTWWIEMVQSLSKATVLQYQISKYTKSFKTLATGYGDFRTSVAKRRRRATEISVFPYGWMEEGVGFVMC